MAERRVERRPDLRGAEERAPITVVPMRRALEDRQVAELRAGFARVQEEIAGLQEYYRSIRIPPASRTAVDLASEADRLEQALGRMRLASNPVLGERYQDELAYLTRRIGEARTAAREGRLGAAVEILGQVNSQISAIGQIFEYELGMLVNGIPINVRIEGVAPDNARDSIFEGVEGLMLDFGTPNEPRGRNGLRAFRLYVDNAGAYNADNQLARGERDAVLVFVIEKGRAAREGIVYTAEQAREDERTLRSFEQNAARLRTQIREYNLSVITDWRSEVAALVLQEQDQQTKRSLETLQTDLDGIIRRLRARQDVADDEMRSVTSRYFILTGRQAPLTEEDRVQRLVDAATELRGSGRTVTDYSQEWFAQRALDFLAQGNTQMASLALSMGLLERSARTGRRGAGDYITEYSEIRDAIARGITPTPALMSRYLSQVESATIDVDVDRLQREYARGGSREKRERVLDAAGVVRQRMRAGDLEGARRLLEMVSAYTDLLARHNWRSWTGSSDMEAALDAERTGTNSVERFGNSLSYYSMMQQVEELRRARESWGRGLSAQSGAFDAAVARIDEQARAGNLREARRGLTLIVMYVDAVQRLGVRRGNQITSLAEGERYDGMTNGLRAFSRGEGTIGNRPAQEVFVESFNSVQLAYIAREAERLDGLAGERSFGRQDVQAALAAARQRAASGDYRGALMLLEFVKEFYGQASAEVPARGGVPSRPARREGWRYALFTARGAGGIQGYERGRTSMLEGIRLEMNATDDQTHISAAQLMEQGARRIEDTQFLIEQGENVSLRFGGAANFIPGEADTMGRIPLGARTGTAYEDYIDVSLVRTYDRQHALTDSVLRGRTASTSALAAIVTRVDAATATGNMSAFNEGVAELSRRGVLTLDVLLYRLRLAAQTGDRAAYNWAVTQLNRRLELVVPRAVRARTIQQMRDRVTDMRSGLTDVRRHYDDAAYNGDLRASARSRQTAIDGIDTRAAAFLTRLGLLENNEEPLSATAATAPLNEFSQLVADANREGRIAGTLTYVNQQASQNEQYRQVVAQERSDRAAGVASRLRSANESFAQARRDLLGGNLEAAYTSYRGATAQRMEALIFYRAEDSPHIDQVELGRVLTLQPLPQGRDSDYYHIPGSPAGDRLDLRFFPVLRHQLAQRGRPDLNIPGFDYYMNGSLQVFSQLLTGNIDGFVSDNRGTVSLNRAPTRTMNAQRTEHVARALAMTEVSVFGTPAGETRSMLLTDYVPRQVEVRRMMERIVTQNYDYSSEGGRALIDGYFQIGQRNLEWMQSQAQTDRKIEMYTMIGIGLAALFIPKVGWAISGAIFIGLAADRVSTEIRVHGHASTEAWVMLGLSIGTLGLAGAAAGIGRAALYTAEAAQTARGLVIASRLATTSTVISRINLGVGIGLMAYGGYHGIQALRAGRTEEGLVNLGLALFPLAHFGGSRAMAYFRPQAVEPPVTVQVARIIEARLPTMEGVRIPVTEPEAVVRAREFQNNPRRLLDFVSEYMGRDEVGRTAMMEGLPRQVRPIVQRLLANDTVVNAARAAREGGPIDIGAMRAIRDAVRTFEIPPDTPAGGGRPIPRPQTDMAGLLNLESLRAFLGDLMVPDGAPAARLNARAAARTRLEAIRGQNPDAAGLIEGMLRNPTIIEDIASGTSTPFSMRMINRAHQQLRGMIPDDVEAAQQQAQAVYTGQLAVQLRYEPAPEVVPALETGGGRTPTRAMAGGDQGGRVPPTVVPGVVRGHGEGGETRGGATREVTPGGRGQVPAERAPPQEVIQIGRFERMWRAGRDAVRGRLARRAEARRVPPAPEEYIAEAQRFLNATLRSVGREAEVSAMIDEATRGLNPDEASQVATNIRNATRNTAELVKLLYARSRSGPAQQQAAARQALLRVYSFENVRTVLGEMAGADRVLSDALGYARTMARQGASRASGGPISIDSFLEGISRRGFDSNDMNFIIQSLEAQTGARVAEINAGMARVETQLGRAEGQLATARANPRVRPLLEAEGRIGTLEGELAAARRTASEARPNTPARTEADARVQTLETQLAQERAALDTARASVRGSRAGRTALERLENLNRQVADLRGQIDAFNAQLRSGDMQPLARTEQMLGMRMSPSERAPMIQNLVDSRVLPESAILDEFTLASRRATGAARGLDVSAGEWARGGQRQPNHLELLRNAVDGSIGREGAGAIDDVLLASLRDPRFAEAVSRRYGERAGQRFSELVREGDLDAVMRRLNDGLPSEMTDPVSGFVRSARSALGEDFAVMNLLGPRAGSVSGGGVEAAVAYGQQLASVRTQLGQMWPARAGRWLLGNVWRYPMRGLFYDIGASGARMWRNAPPEFGGMMKLRGGMRIGLQLLVWGVAGYYMGREIQDIYRVMSGAATIEEGRNEVRRRYGDTVANGITDDVARFIRSEQGRELFNRIPSRFPQGREIRPGNVEELRRALASEEIYFDHDSMPAILSDSAQMSGRLQRINELLATRRTGSADDARTATTELTQILAGFGGITPQQVDDLLSRENKQQLDVTDMFDLRTPDWVRRGLVVRVRDVLVETFLRDSGVEFRRGQGASAFLLQNTEVFVFIWSAVQSGALPINYVDDAITALSASGVMQGINRRVSGTVTLDSLLRETLMGQHLYFEVPAGRGRVEGIRENSFLGILDLRASQDAAFRPVFERILSTYRENPAALQAFNRFNLTEGTSGEGIYGDAEALARLIVENPDTALARAREQGFVGPRMLGELDPSLRNAGGEALVRFVREHSEDASVSNARGLRTWIESRRQQITNLSAILRELSTQGGVATMSPAALQDLADQQIETFRRRGWWRGPTPQERQAAEEAARRRAGTPTGGAPGQRQLSADEQRREEQRQRSPRRPGFEMAPQEPTVQPAQPAQPQQQVIPTMTPEATTFYNDEQRSAGLGLALEGLLLRMYNDQPGDGRVLRSLFGEPTTDAQGQTVLPAAAVGEIKAEVYRLITSTNQADIAIREAWGITVTGSGPTLSVRLNIRTARDALQNYIRQYANRRLAAQPQR